MCMCSCCGDDEIVVSGSFAILHWEAVTAICNCYSGQILLTKGCLKE